MSNDKGLLNKYIVTRRDGKDITGQKFFLLRYDEWQNDKIHAHACIEALRTYAENIKDHLPLLYDDLMLIVNKQKKEEYMIIETINADLKANMLAKNADTVQTLRAVKAAFTNFEKTVSQPQESDYYNVLRKLVKQREDSAGVYQQNQRLDLANVEMTEAKIISSYLPKDISEEEISQLVKDVVAENNLELVKKNMGIIVKLTVAKASGSTNGKAVSNVVMKMITQ